MHPDRACPTAKEAQGYTVSSEIPNPVSADGVSRDKVRLDLGTLNRGAFVRRAEVRGIHRGRQAGAEAGAVWGKAKGCQGIQETNRSWETKASSAWSCQMGGGRLDLVRFLLSVGSCHLSRQPWEAQPRRLRENMEVCALFLVSSISSAVPLSSQQGQNLISD